jgi:hypothetical protein
MKGLKVLRSFKNEKYVTARGLRAYKYYIKPPPQEKGASFFFYKQIITGGNWLHLKPSAKALYPVLKHFSYYDHMEHNQELQSLDYRERQFDYTEAEIDVMAEYAGLSEKSVREALEELEKHYLIEEIFWGVWKVFLKPLEGYLSDHLNEIVADRYKYRF